MNVTKSATKNSSMQQYYAVRTGRTPGIYRSWDECKAQVDGFNGPVYKKFATYNDAYNFFRGISTNTISSSSNYQPTIVSSNDSPPDVVEIYTDGACFNNGYINAQAGIGVFFGDHNPRNISDPLPIHLVQQGDNPTNQLAELYAIARAMEICLAEQSLRTKPIILYTDSKYSINCLTRWLPTWEKNCWILTNGKPVKHQSLLYAMKMQMQNLNIIFRHVAGHANIYGNEQADGLAVKGASQYVPKSHNNCTDI